MYVPKCNIVVRPFRAEGDVGGGGGGEFNRRHGVRSDGSV